MFLDLEDKEKIITFLVKNKKILKSLPQVKLLKKQLRTSLKSNDSSLHDDIMVEFLACCRIPIAEEVSRNTGLATDGIVYIIQCMGIEKFRKYLK